MKSWGNTNVPKTGGNVDRMDWRNLAIGESWTIRLVGDVLPHFVYWVKINGGGNRTRAICNFNRNTELFDATIDDPIGRLVSPKDENVKPAYAYATKVIDRTDGLVKVLEINKKTVLGQIVDFAKRSDYGDPSAEDKGYDFTIKKEKTGPLKQNVKYKVSASRNNTPLTDEEKELVANDTVDLEKLYKQETPEEQLAWMKENTDYLGFEDGLSDNDDDVPF